MGSLLLTLGTAFSLLLAADAVCAPTNRTVAQKTAARGRDVDRDGDGVVTSAELTADLAANYDANGDGLVTGNEFVAAYTCRYGDYADFARAMFANISRHGNPSINIASRAQGNFSVPLGQFLARQQDTYATFAKNQAGCKPKNITIDQKMAAFAKYNDHDGDGFVTTADLVWDLRTNYDANNDDIITHDEFVENYMCVYGDKWGMADFVFRNLTHGAPDAKIPVAIFNSPPWNSTGVPLTEFLVVARDRYATFNGGCLPTTTPLDEKLRVNGEDNDVDGNGKVTEADVAFDLNNRYDANRDGVVTDQEWVDRWTCAFGDSEQFARFVYSMITHGAPSVTTNAFAGEPFVTGIPLADFVAQNRQRYEKFADSGVIG